MRMGMLLEQNHVDILLEALLWHGRSKGRKRGVASQKKCKYIKKNKSRMVKVIDHVGYDIEIEFGYVQKLELIIAFCDLIKKG